MRKKPLVYVAGPLTRHPMHDTHRALATGRTLLRNGIVPFVPHLTVLWDIVEPMHYEDWMEYDEQMLARCDALVRITGESPGADREMAHAKELGIPVFLGIHEELYQWRDEWRKKHD